MEILVDIGSTISYLLSGPLAISKPIYPKPKYPFKNGLISYIILVPICPKPICPFINGHIGSTT